MALENIPHRRKAFIYVSSGYDFDPFPKAREKRENESTKNVFGFADLSAQLSELIRAANHANATIYTIDPRGLVGGPDLDQDVDPVEWQTHVRQMRTRCASSPKAPEVLPSSIATTSVRRCSASTPRRATTT